MKSFILILYCFTAIYLPAQTIILKSGEAMPADGLHREGNLLMTSVKTSTGGSGQVGTPIDNIASLDLPEPPVLTTAPELLAENQPQQALAQIEPVLTFQTTIRDLPGNKWGEVALLKVSTLMALNQLADATALLGDISKYSKNPEILLAAKLRTTEIANSKDLDASLNSYNAIINESTEPSTLSEAWLNKGQISYAMRDYEEALMDYLTITVFYPDRNALMPKALWGAAEAYSRLKDSQKADQMRQQLVQNYPNTPEAALAKNIIMKKVD